MIGGKLNSKTCNKVAKQRPGNTILTLPVAEAEEKREKSH
jgi:hypothetical protein